jgi:NAD(P)-dependent dehydrogenase (short-subunit alcohol dehydrogenase family)
MNQVAGTAIVFGSSGGIGAALVEELERRGGYASIIGLSRSAGDFDFARADGWQALGQKLAAMPPPTLAIVATGMLQTETHRPERSWREIDADWMLENFRVNSVGPALIAQQLFPILPKMERTVFAVLSARVGSVSDNRLGGWHSYRSSKAALNMLAKSFAIELARSHPAAICVALHPGTVDTDLSAPFQSNVEAHQLFTPETSATHLLDVIANLTPADSGLCFDWQGERILP